MSEPIYEYKRGVGWTLQTHQTLSYTDLERGRTITGVLRPPEYGEYGWFFPDEWTFQQALEDVATSGYEFNTACGKYGWKHDGTRNVHLTIDLKVMTVIS